MGLGGDEVARATVSLNLNLDEAQVTAAATRAAQAFDRQFARVQGRFASTTQQATAIRNLSNLFGGAAQQATVLANRLAFVQNSFRGLTNTVTNFGSVGNRTGQVISGISLGLVGVAAAAAAVTQRFAVIAGDFQALEQSLNAIINNSKTAQTTTQEFVGSLRSLAIESGRSSLQLANTGRQFLALGFSGAKTTEVLTAFTKAAALTGATNEQLRLALNGVSQIASKGVVAMEELRRQIAENLPGAVNLARFFEILGENMGISTEEARKLQEQGKVTADVGIKALVQTVNEATEGLDVFALRASTLAGQLGIIREIFTQIIQTGFQPFIQALVPIFKDFTDGFKEGVGPFADIRQSISDLAKTMGESLATTIQEIIPLLPGFIDGFIQLVQVAAPIVVSFIKFASAVSSILIPAIRIATTVLGFFTKAIGESLTLGAFVAGFVRSFATALQVLSRFGGIIGNIGNSVSGAASGLGRFAGIIGVIIAGLNELNVLLGTLRQIIGTEIPAAFEAANQKVQDFIDLIPGLRTVASAIGSGFRSAIDGVQGAFGRLFGGDNRPAKNFTEIEKTATKAAEEIKKEFVDVSALLDDVSSAQKSLTAATKDYQRALRGVKDAQQSVNDALKEAQEDAADAAASVVEATEDLADAQARFNELLAEGGEAELTEAREDLADSTERLADAEDRRADAAQRLADLLVPATQDEIAEATDDVTRAEISLERAIRARDEALAKLNQTQEESIDLSGLSLDQLRSTLANARASADAQRRAGRTTENVNKLKEDAVLTEIDVRDAIRNVDEARKKLTETEQKGKVETDAIRDARDDLARADRDVDKAIKDQIKDRTTLQAIEAGNSQFTKDLAAARNTVADAEERLSLAQLNVAATAEESARRVATARDGVRDAEDRVSEALRRQRDAQQEVNEKVATAIGDQNTLLGIKLQQFAANEALIRQSPKLLESAIANIVASLPALPTGPGAPGAPGAIQRQKLIQGINELLRDPRLPFAEAFRRLGLPGFEEGGLITAPVVARLGEKYKQELVLPLTKPDRVWELLSRNLPRFPAAQAAAASAITGGDRVPRISIAGAGGAASGAQRKANKDLAQAIAAELVAAGLTKGGDTNVTIPVITPTPDPRLLAREIDRRIARRR